jgi:hypothetical protein
MSLHAPRENRMTLCPIALAVGCKKCPAFKICPLKSVIGDYRPESEAPSPAVGQPVKRAGKHSGKRAGKRGGRPKRRK